jgi:hypothetical protein
MLHQKMIKQATHNGFAFYENFKLMLVGLRYWVGLGISSRSYYEVYKLKIQKFVKSIFGYGP